MTHTFSFPLHKILESWTDLPSWPENASPHGVHSLALVSSCWFHGIELVSLWVKNAWVVRCLYPVWKSESCMWAASGILNPKNDPGILMPKLIFFNCDYSLGVEEALFLIPVPHSFQVRAQEVQEEKEIVFSAGASYKMIYGPTPSWKAGNG